MAPHCTLLAFVLAAAALIAGAAPTPLPIIFWNSEGHGPNTTVMAMGSGLDGVSIQLQTATDHVSLAPQVLDSWDASVKFVLPASATTQAYRFRACAAASRSCCLWRTINTPAVTWAQGDSSASASAVATAGAWLKVYGRSMGFTARGDCAAATVRSPAPAFATTATLLSQRPGSAPVELRPTAASCYDASFALPRTLAPGRYTLAVANGLSPSVGNVGVTIAPEALEALWPSRRFPVAVGGNGSDVAAAVAAAGAAGGGVVELGAGTYDMAGQPLPMPQNVRLRGKPGSTSVLRWSQAATGPLISNGVNCSRYLLSGVRIELTAAQASPVIDISGHGVIVRGVTVWMPHTLPSSANVVHTHGATGFEVSGCNLTHDNAQCTPGYPHASVFFFDIGTDSGLVTNNTAFARCTSFVGYSASGVLLENNTFTELPYTPHSQAAGNGFASFGAPRKSERVSYSRNLYYGQFNGDNSPDGSFPHEAFSSDGTGGAYHGLLAAADGQSVSVPGDADAGYVGGAVAILMGKGRGQYRKIQAVVNPPTPPQPPPPPFDPGAWHMLAGHNGSECSATHNGGHVASLWQGDDTPEACLRRCGTVGACKFATVEFFPKGRPGGGYCVLQATCAAMTGWDNHPCSLPAPACLPQNSTFDHVVTYSRPAGLASPSPLPPPLGKYVLAQPFVVQPDTTSFVTVIPFVGETLCMGNEISNSTTLQIYGPSTHCCLFSLVSFLPCRLCRCRCHRRCLVVVAGVFVVAGVVIFCLRG